MRNEGAPVDFGEVVNPEQYPIGFIASVPLPVQVQEKHLRGCLSIPHSCVVRSSAVPLTQNGCFHELVPTGSRAWFLSLHRRLRGEADCSVVRSLSVVGARGSVMVRGGYCLGHLIETRGQPIADRRGIHSHEKCIAGIHSVTGSSGDDGVDFEGHSCGATSVRGTI